MTLRYSMLFRHIIDNKIENRVNELLNVLQHGIQRLASPEDQMAVLRELNGFEQLATPRQKTEACQYLKEISKGLPSNNTGYIDRIVKRFSQN